jgi:hypothetical protein
LTGEAGLLQIELLQRLIKTGGNRVLAKRKRA